MLDASAWVDVARSRAPEELTDVLEADGHWVVPEHFTLEVLSAFRRAYLGGELDQMGYARVVRDLASAQFDVWPTAPLIPRVIQLTQNATTYDAAYVALAEELGCRLVTSDSKFSRVPGIRCQVVGFSAD